MITQKWPALKQGDKVKIIAPGSKIVEAKQAAELKKVENLLREWQLIPALSLQIFQPNPVLSTLANTDEFRAQDLIEAILDPEIKAILCLRGGYGCYRLLPALDKIKPPPTNKLFIGFSDITTLLLYFTERWQWSTIHGPGITQVANQTIADNDIAQLHKTMFGIHTEINIIDLTPMNELALAKIQLKSSVIGGNLTLVHRTIGTNYSFTLHNRILLLEDIEEPARKIDGMLWQMYYANYFNETHKPVAIILGDFSDKTDEANDIHTVLKFWANLWQSLEIPVLRCLGIGHGFHNHPIPFGTSTILQLGEQPLLTCETGVKN